MPTTAINNTQPIRFEQGGTINFVSAASPVADVEINNREKGTLEITQGGYEILDYQNKGLNQVPLEGDEVSSTIRIRCKLTKKGTNDVMSLGQQRDTTTGLVKTYSVTIKLPDYKGAATGTSFAFTNVYFVRPPRITEGTRFDTVEIELASTNAQATYATY